MQNLIPWRRIKKWGCIRCGRCCSTLDIPVTFEEEERLKKYGSVFKRGKIGLYLRKKRGKCIFFKKGSCKIYEERPEACRRYPFYFRDLGEDEALFVKGEFRIYVYVDKECRGIGKGKNVEEVVEEIIRPLRK